MNKFITAIILFCSMSSALHANSLPDMIKKQLKDAGATKYAHDSGWFWDSFDDIYFGYDKNDSLLCGIISQEIKKTYKKLQSYTTVVKKGNVYTVKNVTASGIDKIKTNAQKKIIIDTLAKFKGHVYETDGKTKKIDAVSGATYCHKRVYSELNSIIIDLIKIMKKNEKLKMQPIK